MSPLQILIADDHELVRQGLRKVLEARPDWAICGEARTGRQAIEMAAQQRPDIVVMDIGMPELNGLDATREILKARPQCEVLVLTMEDSECVIRDVLAAGAHGYLLKTDTSQLLVSAIETLATHKPFFTGCVAGIMLQGFLSPTLAAAAGVGAPRLSPRERQVVQLLAEGRANKGVARSLHISVKTVEAHRSNVMHKLGLHSIADLVRYAIRNRIIQA
ncbi:MAG TPA: response regulator transcription factor [Planctomycetota bacterium]|nr:response regulator transcription factor [Planctomycetota bacterium]